MTRRRQAVLIALVLLMPMALSACGAGQVTQTAAQDRDRTGGQGQVGDIAVRAVHLAYPPDGVHDPSEPATLRMAIVNSGRVDDQLIGVAGGSFTGARVSDPAVRPGTPPSSDAPSTVTPGSPPLTVQSEAPRPGAPVISIPAPAGETVFVGSTGPTLELTGLAEPKGAAHSVPVTLTFARAGEVTVLAITSPAPDLRPRAPAFEFGH